MTPGILPKLHFEKTASSFTDSVWTAKPAIQAPYRQVSAGERVYQEVVQSRRNQPLSQLSEPASLLTRLKALPIQEFASALEKTHAPLFIGPGVELARFAHAEFHTTENKKISGAELLADGLVRRVAKEGASVLNEIGASFTQRAANEEILAGGALLSAMADPSFLVGLGSIGLFGGKPGKTKKISEVLDRMKQVQDQIDLFGNGIFALKEARRSLQTSVKASRDELFLASSRFQVAQLKTVLDKYRLPDKQRAAQEVTSYWEQRTQRAAHEVRELEKSIRNMDHNINALQSDLNRAKRRRASYTKDLLLNLVMWGDMKAEYQNTPTGASKNNKK